MHDRKQRTAAIALMTALGLLMPGPFDGSVSADVSRDFGIQPMTVECEALGDTVFEVIAVDHTPGGKMPTLQDMHSSLVFHPQSGTVETVYTAIDHDFTADTDPEDVTPLGDDDPRLDGGYPSVFTILPENPYAYLGGGFSRGGPKANKKDLVDCVVIDEGVSDDGFQNWYGAGTSEAGVTDCVVDGDKQDLCFVPPVLDAEGEIVSSVVYYYVDTYTIKAHLSNNGGANAKSASVIDDEAGIERQGKTKKTGKHRGKGKRGR